MHQQYMAIFALPLSQNPYLGGRKLKIQMCESREIFFKQYVHWHHMAILARSRAGTLEPGAMDFTITVEEFVDIITMHSGFSPSPTRFFPYQEVKKQIF